MKQNSDRTGQMRLLKWVFLKPGDGSSVKCQHCHEHKGSAWSWDPALLHQLTARGS